MLACPASFFTIPNKSEGFQTSWNDRQCGFTYELLSNSKKRMNAMNKMFVVSFVIAVGFVFGGLSSAQPEESTLPQKDRCPVCGMFVSMVDYALNAKNACIQFVHLGNDILSRSI
jgi:hypothetical protein